MNEYARAQATKTGTKTNYYYNANDELQFYVVVRGSFVYDGTTATDSHCGYSIVNTAWSFVSGRSGHAANSALASCTFHLLAVGDKTLSVALYCSPTGVLS